MKIIKRKMCEQLFAKTKVVQKNLKSIKRTRKNYISKKKEIIRNGVARRRNVKNKKNFGRKREV